MSKINMLVCITGEIGSGKTTAIDILHKEGYKTFEMDEYIHQIYKQKQKGYLLIKKYFGKEFVNPKEVDRKKLGKLVFSRREKLNLLNKIMVPIIQAKLKQLQRKKGTIFVELGIYLHHQNKFRDFFDKVILIHTKKSLKISNQKKKMPYIKNLPTIFVGKSNLYSKKERKITKFIVKNNGNLNYFKYSLLKIVKK